MSNLCKLSGSSYHLACFEITKGWFLFAFRCLGETGRERPGKNHEALDWSSHIGGTSSHFSCHKSRLVTIQPTQPFQVCGILGVGQREGFDFGTHKTCLGDEVHEECISGHIFTCLYILLTIQLIPADPLTSLPALAGLPDHRSARRVCGRDVGLRPHLHGDKLGANISKSALKLGLDAHAAWQADAKASLHGFIG